MTAFEWSHIHLPMSLFDVRLPSILRTVQGANPYVRRWYQLVNPLRGPPRLHYLSAEALSHFHDTEATSLRLIFNNNENHLMRMISHSDVRCLSFHNLLSYRMQHTEMPFTLRVTRRVSRLRLDLHPTFTF